MMVTFAALLRLRAADSPPGPAPTITTRCSSGEEGHSMTSLIAMAVFRSQAYVHMPSVTTSLKHAKHTVAGCDSSTAQTGIVLIVAWLLCFRVFCNARPSQCISRGPVQFCRKQISGKPCQLGAVRKCAMSTAVHGDLSLARHMGVLDAQRPQSAIVKSATAVKCSDRTFVPACTRSIALADLCCDSQDS
jgi:hypothetical protein